MNDSELHVNQCREGYTLHLGVAFLPNVIHFCPICIKLGTRNLQKSATGYDERHQNRRCERCTLLRGLDLYTFVRTLQLFPDVGETGSQI